LKFLQGQKNLTQSSLMLSDVIKWRNLPTLM